MTDFSGRRYVVSGAASGIGQRAAEKLLDAGAEVHSLDRNQPTAAVTKDSPVDLADVDSIDKALTELDGEYDALLNIAGVPGNVPGDVVMKVNMFAVRHLTEDFLDRLAPGGNVVIVSSTA